MADTTLTVTESTTVLEVEEVVFEILTSDTEIMVLETPTAQGPPGRDGLNGEANIQLSAQAGNQLQKLPDGLYVQPLSWDTNGW